MRATLLDAARCAAGAIALLLCLGPGASSAASEARIALVIGNNAYSAAPLVNPVNDARAIAAKLEAVGFHVTLHTNASQREMTRAISQFGQELKPGSVALFYYAGHGMQVRGRNFLVPVDAEIVSEASARSESVDLDQLLEQLGPARLSMVILDACRNNPFEGRFRSLAGSGLAQVDAPQGTLLAYATAPGRVAADGNGEHGIYTEELLKALDKPGLKVEDVFKMVRVNVIKATRGLQVPWESSSLTGEFYFQGGEADTQRRAELMTALVEERASREREAQALKQEIEALRSQLQQISTPPRENLALSAPSSRSAQAWASRFETLESMRGQLTFAKASAIVIGAATPEEIEPLLRIEREQRNLPYNSACAFGIRKTHRIYKYCSWRRNTPNEARQGAMEGCAKIAERETCRTVTVNGELHEADFIAVTRRTAELDYAGLSHDLPRLLLHNPP